MGARDVSQDACRFCCGQLQERRALRERIRWFEEANETVRTAPKAVSCSWTAPGRVRVPVEQRPSCAPTNGNPPGIALDLRSKPARTGPSRLMAGLQHPGSRLTGHDFSQWGRLRAARPGRNTVGFCCLEPWLAGSR